MIIVKPPVIAGGGDPLAGHCYEHYGRAAFGERQVGMRHRRAWMQGALGCAAALTLRTRAAHAQPKMTKQQAEYQDQPKGILMCGTCTLFIPPAACKVVEGEVKREGWCNAFDLAD
jgi:hypothetical protein